MTLKEKFKKSLSRDFTINEIEQIADEFAIDFAKWIQFHSELWIKYKTSELLEIYKKEKENKTEWYNEDKTDERIKIIGQNGNNGEHYTL